MIIQVNNCSPFNVSNSKKLDKGLMVRIKPTMEMVMKMINRTILFLYFKVVKME